MAQRSLRRSQAVVPFGVGAIVDFPDESLMSAGIRHWEGGQEVFDERLQSRLGLDYFKIPPTEQEGSLPFVRFPRWLFCPKCRELRPITEWQSRYRDRQGGSSDIPRCSECRIKLVPTRFIVVCKNGHIDDFPWIEWVHRNERCSKPQLKITTGTTSSGLSGIRVRCSTCSKSANMSGSFGDDALEGVINCSGFMPWRHPGDTHEPCNSIPRTVQRGGSNVYFPTLASSILIPPYTSKLRTKIKGTGIWSTLSTVDIKHEGTREDLITTMAEQINADVEEVKRTVRVMQSDSEDAAQSEVEYRYDEYLAFRDSTGIQDSSDDFIIEKMEPHKYNLDFLSGITLVHRLRELRTLLGFSRLEPRVHTALHSDDGRDVQVRVRSIIDNSHWAPAMEVRGEGIFVDFDEEHLEEWGKQLLVAQRGSLLNRRYQKLVRERAWPSRTITAKFILIHTFAHLLIRRLSFESGYGNASLRERIYCNETAEQPSMQGVLIYTASGDSEGSLGGLVRQGRPDYFPNVIANAIEEASWCSSDPLCIESSGQGLDSLNLSACHACVLLPETSCEEMNRFLDRGLVTGTIDDAFGFFSHL